MKPSSRPEAPSPGEIGATCRLPCATAAPFLVSSHDIWSHEVSRKSLVFHSRMSPLRAADESLMTRTGDARC